MNWLLPTQLTALTELQAACDQQGSEFAIIGAGACRAWFSDTDRDTEDVDVAVAIDLDEFAQLTEALSGLGWREEERREHRWHTPLGARVDRLPAGHNLRAAGRIEWPRSGTVMDLAGFEHVFAQAVNREVAPSITFRVVPIPVLALLKIASFIDSPYARQKDAQDIMSILGRYEIDGDRRLGEEVYDAGLDYGRAGAFLLGQDLAALCSEDEAALVARFVQTIRDDSTAEAVVFARAAARTADAGEGYHAMLAALAAGFSQARGRGTSR